MTHQSMRLLRDITNTEVDPTMSLVAVNQQMQNRAIQAAKLNLQTEQYENLFADRSNLSFNFERL